MWKFVRLPSVILNINAISRSFLVLPIQTLTPRLIHVGILKLHFLDEVRQVEKLDKKLEVLDEADLEERHVRGWGGGGQKTNKTANCVALTHIPTGLTVKVHSSRSLIDNKKIARARLRMKVDIHVRGEKSVLRQEELRLMRQKTSKSANAKNNLELKKKLKHILDTDKDSDKLY